MDQNAALNELFGEVVDTDAEYVEVYGEKYIFNTAFVDMWNKVWTIAITIILIGGAL